MVERAQTRHGAVVTATTPPPNISVVGIKSGKCERDCSYGVSIAMVQLRFAHIYLVVAVIGWCRSGKYIYSKI